jgi:hypothetical protein
MASIKSKRKVSFDVEKCLNTIGSVSKAEYRRKPEDIETSEAKTIVQEKAELKQLCNEFAQQVANILRMPSVPSERAQQALNITETLADIRRKIGALGNYGGAGVLAALEMMPLITEAHQEFALAVAGGWITR